MDASAAVATIGPSPAPNRTDGPKVESSQTEKQQNILRSATKLTPWTSSVEFNAVGRGLLLATGLFAPPTSICDDGCCSLTEEEQNDLEYAIKLAAIWTDQCEGGRLPHSVETSAALAGALLEDALAHDDPACHPSSQLSLRLSYSSAVVRATNGLADASVVNRASKTPSRGISVAALCEKLGIPGWIVDMRHDAAHNELPSLSSLRLAAKSLLAYLGDRYWSEIARLRQNVMVKAMNILDEYQMAAMEAAEEQLARIATQIAKAEARRDERKRQRLINAQKEAEKESDDDDQSGDEEWEGFGQYSIFMDTGTSSSSKSGKSKSRKRPRATELTSTVSDDKLPTDADGQAKVEATTELSSNCIGNDTNTNINITSVVVEKKKRKRSPSPLSIVKSYLEEIPIDIGMQMLLSYLVWGGVGKSFIPEMGALVSLPDSSDTQSVIGASAKDFDKLKATFDLLLVVIANAYTGFLQALIVNLVDLVILIEERMSDGVGDGNEATISESEEFKLCLLSSWIAYVISRDFHSHFDPFLGIYPRGNMNLSKKRWKWTEAHRKFMSDCAPLETLQRWHLPLHSLYDRCKESRAFSLNGKVSELAVMLENAGRLEYDGKLSKQKESRKSSKVQEDNTPQRSIKTDASMSLEQMEALLSDSDADGGEKATVEDTEKSDNTGGETNRLETIKTAPSTWIKCEHWDSCLIGTLPGYPSY